MDLLAAVGAGNGDAKTWFGGTGTLIVEGTFDSAEVVLQIQSPAGTWLDTTARLSAVGAVSIAVPPGQVRAVVTGGDTPSGISAWLVVTGA